MRRFATVSASEGSCRPLESVISGLLRDREAHLVGILLTHAHADHSGGARRIAQAFNCPTWASPIFIQNVERGITEEVVHLGQAKAAGVYPMHYAWEAPLNLEPIPPRVMVGDLTVWAVPSPGHSADHVVYYVMDREDQALACFSGDHLFARGRISTQPISDCDLPAYIRSLQAMRQRPFAQLYPGHGVPVLQGGNTAVEMACQHLEALRMPPNLV